MLLRNVFAADFKSAHYFSLVIPKLFFQVWVFLVLFFEVKFAKKRLRPMKMYPTVQMLQVHKSHFTKLTFERETKQKVRAAFSLIKEHFNPLI
jgi:hypothetical protein